MVREDIRLILGLENGKQIKEALQLVGEYMGADAGCKKSRINIEIEGDIRLCITSEWRDRLCHQRYVSSDAFLVLMILLDMAITEPKIKYEVVEGVHGLEYLSEQRLGDSSPM